MFLNIITIIAYRSKEAVTTQNMFRYFDKIVYTVSYVFSASQ